VKRKPTLHDLAREAKLSPATVSRVAAGNPTVDPAIRERVRQVAAKLGMNLAERRKDKSQTIAFLLANRDVLHSFQARVLVGAEKYCSQHNWEMLFMSFHYEPSVPSEALHLPQLLSSRTSAQAVILAGTNSPNLLQAFDRREIPFAVLGNNVVGKWQPQRCDVVFSDDIQGAFDATTYLIAKGHKRIAFVGNLDLPWFARCSTGYERALAQAGLEPQPVDLRSDGAELGYLGGKAILNHRDGITAVLAGSDQVAIGLVSALRESSVSIPDDISVVGFNDTQSSLFYPPLTSVREFPEELGRHLAEFVIKRIQTPSLPSNTLTIPTQLVVRESVREAAPLTAVPHA
jgi:DNA-binding LacI/PurR family transcriptional regulator